MRCQLTKKTLVDICLNNNQSCLLCDEPAEQAHPICTACEGELPWLDEHCRICALPLPINGMLCDLCARRRPAFRTVEAPWHYGFPIDALITRFKHQRQWPQGRLLALMLGNRLVHRFAEGLPRPALLLPVPMSAQRLRRRGYNQAAMLGTWLAAQLAIPCDDRLLSRPRDTPAQQELDARARRRNLKDAFAITRPDAIDGLHLALVDDVLTTGATAQTLARLLRDAGAARVDVYCLARTPRPGSA